MRIYLDTSAIQRPLDDYSQTRILLEAEAVMGILEMCAAGRADLVASDALEYEMSRSPWPMRREHSAAVLAMAKHSVELDDSIEQRAEKLTKSGFRPLDALHLALAEAAEANYFCACDDRLLRKSRRTSGLRVKVLSPIELIEVLNE